MRHSTRLLVRIVAVLSAAMLVRCAMPMIADAGGGPPHVLLPRTPSILPLGVGNQWRYSYTSYDSSGAAHPSTEDLNITISGVYGRLDDSMLVRLSDDNFTPADSDTYQEFVYEYAQEGYNQGDLVTYRDAPGDVRGLYVVGSFTGASTALFDTARLWLAYAADPGASYYYTADTATSARITVLSVRDTFFCPYGQTQGASPMHMYECYLYEDVLADTSTYYYYNDEVGMVGYLQYVSGIRRVSCMLMDFEQSWW